MVLDGEGWLVFAAESLVRVVVEVQVRQLDLFFFKRVGVHAEAVVLAGDFDLSRLEILDGVIGSTVAELELVCLGAERQGENLVAEADAEDGDFAEEFADGFDGVFHGRRVAGAVTQKYAVRFSRYDLFGGCRRGYDVDVAAVRAKQAENILLDAVIEGNDLVFLFGRAFDIAQYIDDALFPAVSFLGGDIFDDVPSDQAGVSVECLSHIRCAEFGRRDNTSHGSFGADVSDEGACVDAFEADDVVGFEIIAQRSGISPTAGIIAVFLNDKAGGEDFFRFPIGLVRAVVADQGVRHRDYLLVVGRVGEYFLVAGHGRIEDNFAALLACGAEGGTFKNSAVFQ